MPLACQLPADTVVPHLGVEVRPSCTKTEDVHRTMRLFAEHVMPVLGEEAAKAEH